MRLPDILLTRIQAVRVAIRGETTLLLVVFNDSPLPVHHVQSELYHFRNHSTSCRETFTLYPARLVVISIVVRCCQTRSYSKESGFVEKRGSMSSVSSCGSRGKRAREAGQGQERWAVGEGGLRDFFSSSLLVASATCEPRGHTCFFPKRSLAQHNHKITQSCSQRR
jgi:hypothetical protein